MEKHRAASLADLVVIAERLGILAGEIADTGSLTGRVTTELRASS
jgi:hypothetical protein